MQFHGYIFLPRNPRGALKIRAKGLYIAKIWPKSKIFQLFRNFTKISIYTKNDEMNMFGEFRLKITPRSAKTVTPIFVKIPKNWVSQKCTNRKIQSVAAFKKWLKNDQNWSFLTFDPIFPKTSHHKAVN